MGELATFVLHFFAAAIGSAGVALLFRAEKRAILPGALLGGCGYLLYDILLFLGANMMGATFVAALFVGLAGEALARAQKSPAIVYNNIGIISLVPGYGIYSTMLYFVEGKNEQALTTFVQTLLVAAAIAVALGLAAATMKRVKRFLSKGKNTV